MHALLHAMPTWRAACAEARLPEHSISTCGSVGSFRSARFRGGVLGCAQRARRCIHCDVPGGIRGPRAARWQFDGQPFHTRAVSVNRACGQSAGANAQYGRTLFLCARSRCITGIRSPHPTQCLIQKSSTVTWCTKCKQNSTKQQV